MIPGFFGATPASRHMPRHPQCTRCGGCRGGRTEARVTGCGASGVMFVVSGRDTTLPHGFAGILHDLHVSLADVWIVNTTQNGSDSEASIGCCRSLVFNAIKEKNPVAVVLVGSHALSSVVSHLWGDKAGQIERWVGYTIPDRTLNTWICPTWGLIPDNDPVIYGQVANALKRVFMLVEGKWRPWPGDLPKKEALVKRIYDVNEAADWLKKCMAQKTGAISFDYETNRLKPDAQDSKIYSCSVAWGRLGPERCIAFPWHGDAVRAMSNLLQSPIPKIGANMKFEERWTMATLGHPVRNWRWDTLLGAHVTDNVPGNTSVKFQAYLRLGVPLWNLSIAPLLESQPGTDLNSIHLIDLPDLLMYNGLDSVYEFEIAVDQLTELGFNLPWEV